MSQKKKSEPESSVYYQWFVEPLDAHTNGAIARELAAQNLSDSQNIGLLDGDGNPHDVYQLESYSWVSKLIKSRIQASLQFKIYKRYKNQGVLVEWLFGEKKKKTKAANSRAVK